MPSGVHVRVCANVSSFYKKNICHNLLHAHTRMLNHVVLHLSFLFVISYILARIHTRKHTLAQHDKESILFQNVPKFLQTLSTTAHTAFELPKRQKPRQ